MTQELSTGEQVADCSPAAGNHSTTEIALLTDNRKENTMERALVCNNLSKHFVERQRSLWEYVCDAIKGRKAPDQKTVVDSVSFEVAMGEIFGILGPNGSGKSTLIRMISTLLIPDEGNIAVFGHDAVEQYHQVRPQLNRVSVDAALFSKLSAVENLLYAARLYGIAREEQLTRVKELLVTLGFKPEQMSEPIETFSRGMQQKVSIARAFLSRPRLLLLDEPTTGLDPRSKREVQALIKRLKAAGHTAIVLTTHDMYEAERLCDRVAVINKGQFVALDTPQGLKKLLPKEEEERTLEQVFLHLTGALLDEDKTTESNETVFDLKAEGP